MFYCSDDVSNVTHFMYRRGGGRLVDTRPRKINRGIIAALRRYQIIVISRNGYQLINKSQADRRFIGDLFFDLSQRY